MGMCLDHPPTPPLPSEPWLCQPSPYPPPSFESSDLNIYSYFSVFILLIFPLPPILLSAFLCSISPRVVLCGQLYSLDVRCIFSSMMIYCCKGMSEQPAVREAKNSLFLKQICFLSRNGSYFLPLQSAVIGCETVYASTPVRADNFNILYIFAIQGLSDFLERLYSLWFNCLFFDDCRAIEDLCVRGRQDSALGLCGAAGVHPKDSFPNYAQVTPFPPHTPLAFCSYFSPSLSDV